jgi:transposase
MFYDFVTMKEMVILNKKEQRRLVVLNQVGRGRMTGREASEVLGLSLRHTRRLLAAYRKEGAAALAHGNCGRKPYNALDEGVRRKVSELSLHSCLVC